VVFRRKDKPKRQANRLRRECFGKKLQMIRDGGKIRRFILITLSQASQKQIKGELFLGHPHEHDPYFEEGEVK